MDFGSVTQTPFATYDPDSSSWRTWEPFLFEDSTSFSDRWPKSGTTLGGHAYELPTSALPTNATVCSSSPGLGAPTVRTAKGKNAARIARGEIDGLLELQVATLPTPVVNDMGVNKTVEWWDDWVEEQKAQHSNGNGHGNSLAIEVYRRTGDPTPGPSPGGASSSDDPPPDP